MEQKETQRGGQNRERLSRRLSSILKAPRPSMKVCGNDQDEKQEETRPIEKRRSSRRVSFATTNNIHVFPKDTKADPILAPIQNLTVGVSDGQNDRMQCFDTHEIMGLDSMLTTPVHFALNKENFFPEPVLPFDTVDRTVLLGENTGYMDMTCSETIQIDMNDEYNPQLTLNMSSVGEPHKLISQKAMPCKTFGSMEKDVMTSDFSGFLSSLPTAKAQNVVASFPKKNNNHFTLENTSNAKIDKENIPSTSSTRPLLLGRDHMTSSQTLIKEERGAFQRVPYSVGGNSMSANTWSSSNYLDDMELTQTVTKNFNGMENANQSMSDGNRAKCKFVCDDSSEMIMTEVLDDYVQDQEQLSKQNRAGQFQSNVLFAPTVDSDDMEVTQSQTAVFETKYGRELFAQSSKAASGIGECKRNVTLATRNVFHSGHGKFMDPVLSGCTNVAVDMKHISTTKPQASIMLPKLEKMADLPLSRVVDDMEMTQCPTVHVDLEKTRQAVCDDMEMTQCHTVHVDLEKTRQGVRDDLEKTRHTVCDDMEMTECQTVCDDLEKTRHTVCDSMEMTQCHTVCDDMEMTECQTVRVDLEKTRQALRDVTHNLQIPTHVTQCHTVRVGLEKPRQAVHDDMEMTGCHTVRVGLEKPRQAVHDDMEMTGCHTVRVALEKPRQAVHDDMEMTGCHTVRVALEKPRQAVHDDMEMTGCHTVRVDLEKPRQAVHDDMEMTGCHTVRVDLEKTRQAVHDDMEMTGCHTVRVDLEKPRQAVHDDMEMTGCHTVRVDLEKPRQAVHDDMEMTGCHTVRVDLEKPRQAVHDDMEMTGCHTVRVDLEKPRQAVHDDMEMTGCHTVAVDLEKTRQAVHDDMEMTGCHTVAVDLEKTRHTVCNVVEMTKYPTVDGDRCDDHKSKKRLSLMSFRAKGITHKHTGLMELDRYSFSKRTKTENRNILQGTASNTHFGEDLDLTGCRTINIDTKISPLNNMQSSLCVSSSSPTLDKMKRSERMVETPGTGRGSHVVDCNAPVSVTDLDAANLVDKHKRAIDQPVDTKNTSQKISEETDHPSTMTKTVSSARKEGYVLESDVDTLEMKAQSSAKSRRRSLADLQVKLQNMSQYIREQDGLLAGSVTAPLVSLTAVSPVENHSGRGRSSQPSKETPNEKQINLAQKGSTTPFNLKNSLMARLSVGGIMPKFPTRARSASPNQTEPISPNVHQKLQVQTLSSTDVQNDSYETDLIDEVLPEEDLSGTLFSYLSKNTEQEFPGVPLNEDATEHDQMKSDEVINMSQSEEMATEVKDETTKDTSKKLWDSNYAAQNAPVHLVKMIDDANFSSNSTMMKCDGISELTLRNSQLDSQMEGTMDDEFDFYKKLEEGSVTVNDFLTHFGAKFVIHRSRPSALPDNFGAAQTYTMEDLLREKYIHRPKQKVYETDCQKLSEMAEGFKAQMADQDKPLRSINGTLLQDMCAFSKDQLQRFGAKLKERRVYFRKLSKALSHKMKKNLYSELLNTTKEAKQNLTSKIKETNEMLKDLDGCINDLESELTSMNNIFMGDQHSLIRLEPVLKAKQEQLDALNSEVTVKETQICKLELQAQSLEDTWDKVQDEIRELKRCTTDLNSLNEWRFNPGDGNGVAFTFLHNTVQLEVKHKKAIEKGQEGVEQEVDISVKFLLNAESSEPSAILIHKLLTENINSQAKWMQKYSTARDVPMLLHEFGVVVSRLRLLGEEIHRLKKWGGLSLGILHITCLDTSVEVMVSSVRAFVKFELSLAVPPDYPFRPLQLQKFQNHIGETRLEQIKDIISSVRPAKNYLTTVMKRIHSDLLR